MYSKPLQIATALGVLLLLVVVIIVLAVTLASNGNDVVSVTSGVSCLRDDVASLDSFSRFHPRCNSMLPLNRGCPNVSQNGWILFERSSYGFSEALQFVPDLENGDFNKIFFSPSYTLPQQSCSLQISFQFPFDLSATLFIMSSNVNDSFIKLTSDQCHTHVIDDRNFLARLKSFKLIILANSVANVDKISGSVTSQPCYAYQTIGNEPIIRENPSFYMVPRGTRDRCSSEIMNGMVDCDWMIVNQLGNENFTWVDHHPCLVKGASIRPEDSAVWYLFLNGTHPQTRGYLISPIVEGGTSHVLLSFWYIAQCNNTKIKVYVIPSVHDIGGILGDIPPVYEVKDVDEGAEWVFTSLEIKVSPEQESYQIVLEGILSSGSDCTRHSCHVDIGQTVEEPSSPLLAFDEMTVEAKFDTCNASSNSNSSILDCSFEKEDNSSTACVWISAANPGVPIQALHLFGAWKADNRGNDGPNGATASHLEGRGYVMTFDSSQQGFGNYFRSPVLLSNSNCSCRMTFFFLLRGRFAPRLQLSLRLGNDPKVSDIELDTRPVIPQWSLYGHQGEDFIMADITLNLPASTPFQIEFRAIANIGQGEANLDDFYFDGCDFRIYS